MLGPVAGTLQKEVGLPITPHRQLDAPLAYASSPKVLLSTRKQLLKAFESSLAFLLKKVKNNSRYLMPSFEAFCSLNINSAEWEANSASAFFHVLLLLLTSPFGQCVPWKRMLYHTPGAQHRAGLCYTQWSSNTWINKKNDSGIKWGK